MAEGPLPPDAMLINADVLWKKKKKAIYLWLVFVAETEDFFFFLT